MLITNKEYLSTYFFLGRAMFLGIGFSFMYRYSGTDAWISIILGYLVGNLFILAYDKTAKNINYNLNNFLSKKKLMNQLFKFIFLFTYSYLVIYVSIIFTNYVKVYYLFETPIYITLFFLLSVAYYTTLKSENTILRLSIILFGISLLINILNTIFLINFVELINFLPIYTHSSVNILQSTLIFAIFSSIPNILLLEYKVPLKTKLKSYFIVFVIISIINFSIIGVLGEYLIESYSYPEYMVLRRIKLLNFIENVENFASIIWYFDAFILITLALSKTRKMFHTKKKDIVIPVCLITFIIAAFSILSRYYSATATFFQSGIIILGILLILTGPVLLICSNNFKKNVK